MTKNALAYISRKRNRSLIAFILIALVLSSLYSCFYVAKSIGAVEKSIYKLSNSSISIASKNAKGTFHIKDLSSLDSISNIEEITAEYAGTAKLTSGSVFDGAQKIQRDDLPQELNNLVPIHAVTESRRNLLFRSGAFFVEDGRALKEGDKYKILVHKELAKKNSWKLHDKVSLSIFKDEAYSDASQAKTFEIVGIFSGKTTEQYTGLSSDLSENMVFTDYYGSQRALGLSKDDEITTSMRLYVKDAQQLDKVKEDIKALDIDWSKYEIIKDSKAFEQASGAVLSMKHIIRLISALIVIGAIVVLTLILILWIRERTYEIGILLSIGFSKFRIMSQFILELVFISLPALIVALLSGSILISQLLGAIVTDESAFVQGGLYQQGFGLDNITSLLQCYAVLIGIIVISVVAASATILVKKPKDILSKVS